MSQSYASETNWTAEQIEQACHGALHPMALRGFQAYNAGDYFQAHEELETAWRDERGPVRDVYRGILQVGLGYYHILRVNYRGAVKMFQRCRQWLDPFPAVCRGVDLDQLRRDYLRAEEELHRLGPEHLAHFDRGLLKPLIFKEIATEHTEDTERKKRKNQTRRREER